MTTLKILIEKHPDGYGAYSVGIKGVVVGQEDSYEEVPADVTSVIAGSSWRCRKQRLPTPWTDQSHSAACSSP